jgi:hypothetical protein
MTMDHLVISILADGTIQVDGPVLPGFLESMNRYFEVMGITSPQEKAAEIARLAPSAQKVMTQ